MQEKDKYQGEVSEEFIERLRNPSRSSREDSWEKLKERVDSLYGVTSMNALESAFDNYCSAMDADRFMPLDFCEVVRMAVQTNTTDLIKRVYNADADLALYTSPKTVVISHDAFFRGYHDTSLEDIFWDSHNTNNEIAFTAIIDMYTLKVLDFVKGDTGCKDYCEWTTGGLIEHSFDVADRNFADISLAHTHPVIVEDEPELGFESFRPYGAMFSKIFWKKEELESFNDFVSRLQLDTGIHKAWPADWTESRILQESSPSISNFCLVMSPRLNQLGIFEMIDTNEERIAVYHPWKIV